MILGLKPTPWSADEYQRNLLIPVGRVVTSMERAGCPVSIDELRDIESRMGARANDLRAELRQWTGTRDVNWNSWQQLAQWLHGEKEEGGLALEPSPYCKKGEVPDGEIKTDDRALEWLAGHHEDHCAPIQALRLLRQCERMARYARDWLAAAIPHADGTHRLHPSFGLASDHDTRPGAVTGRFGVKNPPLNQVPRNKTKDPAGMRRAFVAPPGCRLIVVDYSQLEVVILAHLIAILFGDDDPLVSAVRANEDIHGLGARRIFGELAKDESVAKASISDFKTVPALAVLRDITKTGIYGRNYGKGKGGFATSFFLPDGSPLGEDRASLLCDGLDLAYPGVPKYQDYIREWLRRYAFIMSLFGRWQPMPNAKSSKMGLFNRAWRQSLNYGMQAGGQEIMALAIIAISLDERLRELGFVLSLVVHDEIVGWAPEAVADECLGIVEEIMVSVVELMTPLRAKGHTGINWMEAK